MRGQLGRGDGRERRGQVCWGDGVWEGEKWKVSGNSYLFSRRMSRSGADGARQFFTQCGRRAVLPVEKEPWDFRK
jgi:hypothetical protein